MIENPGAARGPLRLGESGVEIRIDVEAHRGRFPLDGVEMKSVGKILAGRLKVIVASLVGPDELGPCNEP
jgi:hypothetical protein